MYCLYTRENVDIYGWPLSRHQVCKYSQTKRTLDVGHAGCVCVSDKDSHRSISN